MASLERDTVIWIIIAMISGFYIGLHSASFIFKRNTSHQQTCTPESEVKTLAQTIPDYASTCNDLSRLEFPARPLHVILIATGSVASVKVPFMVTELLKYQNILVQVIASQSSLHFFDAAKLQHDRPDVHIWTDHSDWKYFKRVGDPILHIELRRWADLVLIAPCSANTLARVRYGAADSLATAFLLALNRRRTLVWVFPAMNTQMWHHPSVQKNIAYIKEELAFVVHNPIQKGLACGDDGIGAMMEWSDIVSTVVTHFRLKSKAHAGTLAPSP